jgi:two-component system, NarL family, nitrate/nitrite response regulator NarL
MNLTDPPRITHAATTRAEPAYGEECLGPSASARHSRTQAGSEQAWRFDASVKDYGLTQVEAEVLALTAQGLSNYEVAQRRGSSEGTVKVHMNRIFTKLKVRSRCEAIAFYLQLNNVDPEELRRAQAGHMDMKWLLSTMTHERHPKGTVLFRSGDVGDKIYYLQRGIVALKEIGVDMEPHALFGEIGVFAPEHRRTCTALCKTHVDLFTLTFEEVRRCYFLNPQFAFYVMYLVTQRLMADRDRVRTGAR